MKKNKRIVIILAVLVLAAAGSLSTLYSHRKISTAEMDALIDSLQAAGYQTKSEAAKKDILQGERYVVYYDNRQFLNVFLYPTVKEAQKDAGRLDETGNSYTKGGITGYTMQIDYSMPIHYYRKENMIVSWAGESKEMEQFLKQALGEQFAGH